MANNSNWKSDIFWSKKNQVMIFNWSIYGLVQSTVFHENLILKAAAFGLVNKYFSENLHSILYIPYFERIYYKEFSIGGQCIIFFKTCFGNETDKCNKYEKDDIIWFV